MLMPETPMNKNDFFTGRKYKIRFSREAFPMKPKTVA